VGSNENCEERERERERWTRQNGIATKVIRLIPKTKVSDVRWVDWMN
jgi:hypothetical protein